MNHNLKFPNGWCSGNYSIKRSTQHDLYIATDMSTTPEKFFTVPSSEKSLLESYPPDVAKRKRKIAEPC